jgi:type I site-specific restriction endonuclease
MKKDLSERDICNKFITPAIKQAGWDNLSPIRTFLTPAAFGRNITGDSQNDTDL